MADYTYYTRHVIQHRWELKLPTNATEVDKAITAAVHCWESTRHLPIPDDALTITTEDDILVISFTEEKNQ